MVVTKRRDHFQSLKELAGLLNRRERRIAAAHIAGYDMCDTKHNKGLQLFNLLLQKKSLTREQAKARVSDESQERTFDRLCRTTLAKVTESLTFAINTQKPPFGVFARERYAVHNGYDEATILMYKGATSLAKERLWDALLASTRFEMFAERLELTAQWKWLMAAESKPKEWRKYEILEQEAEDCYKALRAVISSFLYHQMMEDRAGTGKYPSRELRDAVIQADRYVAETGAVTVEFWARQLKMEYYAFYNCHVANRHIAQKLLNLLNENGRFFKPSDSGNLYYQIGVCDMRLFNFQEAVGHLKSAMQCYECGSMNHRKAQQETGLAHWYLGDYNTAVQCLSTPGTGRLTDDPQAKFHLAYALFMQGNHKTALLIVRTITAFDDEQAGYNIGLRILEGLIQVELADFTGLEATIAAFQGYVRDGAGLAAARPRDLAIVSFLKTLLSVSFDYRKAVDAGASTLAKLARTDTSYCWRVRSHELLLTHNYFRARANGEAYNPEVPQAVKDAERVDEEQFRIGVA